MYLIPILLLVLLVWLLIVMPQRRRQRAHVAMQDSVGVGDEIITAGGLHGDVLEIEDDTLRIEIAPDVVVRVDRRAIAAVARELEDERLPADEEEPLGDEDAQDAEETPRAG